MPKILAARAEQNRQSRRGAVEKCHRTFRAQSQATVRFIEVSSLNERQSPHEEINVVAIGASGSWFLPPRLGYGSFLLAPSQNFLLPRFTEVANGLFTCCFPKRDSGRRFISAIRR